MPMYIYIHMRTFHSGIDVFLGLCTQWPAGLPDDDAIRHHFPVQVESSDYLFSGPSIRDERARVVSFKVACFGVSLLPTQLLVNRVLMHVRFRSFQFTGVYFQ